MFTERQQEIIKAAIELIAEKGIQQLTIKNLAKKIGLAEGAIYRHFESKIDILLGILGTFRDSKADVMRNISGADLSASEKLQTIFRVRFSQFTENPALAAVIFSEEIFQNEERLSQKVRTLMEESQKTIGDLIHAGQQSGEFRADISAEQLSLLITGALRLLVTKWRLSGQQFDLEQEGRQLWQTIERIVKK